MGNASIMLSILCNFVFYSAFIPLSAKLAVLPSSFYKPIYMPLGTIIVPAIKRNQREMTGTFIFKKITKASNNDPGRRKSGWNVSGCYCPGGQISCDCNVATNRVKLFLDQKHLKNRFVQSYNGKKRSKYRKSNLDLTDFRSASAFETGCYCNSSGCVGTSCEYLNGCVCNSKDKCWGNNCPDTYSALHVDSINDSTQSPLEFEKSAAFPFQGTSEGASVMKIPADEYEDSIAKENNIKPTIGLKSITSQNYASRSMNLYSGCVCDHKGCKGPNCRKMNGCVCIGTRCWGSECVLLTSSTIGRLRNMKFFKYNKRAKGRDRRRYRKTPMVHLTEIPTGWADNFGEMEVIKNLEEANPLKLAKTAKGTQMDKNKSKVMGKTKGLEIEKITGTIIPVIRAIPVEENIGNVQIDESKPNNVAKVVQHAQEQYSDNGPTLSESLRPEIDMQTLWAITHPLSPYQNDKHDISPGDATIGSDLSPSLNRSGNSTSIDLTISSARTHNSVMASKNQ